MTTNLVAIGLIDKIPTCADAVLLPRLLNPKKLVIVFTSQEHIITEPACRKHAVSS